MGKDQSKYPGKHTSHTTIRTTHQTQEQNHSNETGITPINTATCLDHPTNSPTIVVISI
jgi:hypothetical protein